MCNGRNQAGPLARLILPTIWLWIRFSNFDPEYKKVFDSLLLSRLETGFSSLKSISKKVTKQDQRGERASRNHLNNKQVKVSYSYVSDIQMFLIQIPTV